MTLERRVAALRAEVGTLTRLIEATDPDDVSRIGLRHRLAEVNNELALATQRVEMQAEVSLLFRGSPVVDQRGIEAAFLSNAVEKFQKLVARASAAGSGKPLHPTGPIPDAARSKLFVTDTARGSFGVVLQELADENTPLTEPSPLRRAVVEVTRLMAAASTDDEAFSEHASDVDATVMSDLGAFLKYVHDSGARLRVHAGDTKASLDDSEVLWSATERVVSTRFEELDEERDGRLYVLPGRRKFELRAEGGETVAGAVGKGVDVAELEGFISKRVRAQIRTKTTRRGTHATTRHSLLRVTPHEPG